MLTEIFGLNLTADPMSTQEINQYRQISNFVALISLIYGILTILLILRYTTHSMLNYRFHLLNMSLTILLCDLSIAAFSSPHTIFPGTGICMVGLVSPWLTKQFGVDASFFISLEIIMIAICSSLAAVTNATLHRYISITRLLEPLPSALNPRNVKIIMICLQVVFPVSTAGFALLSNLHTTAAIEYNINNYPEIFKRTSSHPCLLVPTNLFQLILSVIFIAPILIHGIFCAFLSIYMLYISWVKIYELQHGKNVSRKTIELHKRMIISITIQTLAPNALVAFSLILMGVGFVIKFEFIEIISGVLAFHLCSLHSVLNCLVLWWSIPAYKDGVFNDLKTIFYYFRFRARSPPPSTIVKHTEKNTEFK